MKKNISYSFVAICMLFIASCGNSDNAESVAKTFIEAAFNGDLKTVVEVSDLPEDQMTQVTDDAINIFKDHVNQCVEKEGGVDDIVCLESEVDEEDGKARIKFEVKFKNRETEKEKVKLIKKMVNGLFLRIPRLNRLIK